MVGNKIVRLVGREAMRRSRQTFLMLLWAIVIAILLLAMPARAKQGRKCINRETDPCFRVESPGHNNHGPWLLKKDADAVLDAVRIGSVDSRNYWVREKGKPRPKKQRISPTM